MTLAAQRVIGTVVRGDGRGRELGYPTANLDTRDPLPLPGVYAAWVRVHAQGGGAGKNGAAEPGWIEATVSVGDNPTFGDVAAERAECFLHDFSGDLYGRCLEVVFVAYIREMAVFSAIDELIDHAARDVSRSRVLLQQHPRVVS